MKVERMGDAKIKNDACHAGRQQMIIKIRGSQAAGGS
jgi:hypothetical protein